MLRVMSITSYANPYVLDLVAYQPGKPIEETARELGMNPADIVKLASNENSLGPSPKAVEAMQRAAAGAHVYPDGASFDLRSRIAADFGVSFEQTVVGSGSSEIIELLCHAFLHQGLALVAARHSFSMYPIMCKLFGAQYIEVENKPDWSHDLMGMLRAITPETRLVFITNPTNPLGTMVHQQELDDFMAQVPDHVVVAIDEAYIDFADDKPDTVKYVREGRNVIVMRTFSKAYGLAGIRAGVKATELPRGTGAQGGKKDLAMILSDVPCAVVRISVQRASSFDFEATSSASRFTTPARLLSGWPPARATLR